MVNKRGKNGHNNGEAPRNDVLKASLLQYAKEQLPVERRLARLGEEHGYYIKSSKLHALNKKFDIPSVRHPPPLPEAVSHVAQKVEEDLNGMNGPDTVARVLATSGVLIPRDTVREIMHALDPEGAERRAPGPRGRIPRVPLISPGVMFEVCCDGHEKFSSLALAMGSVGIDIYGMREKASGKIVCLMAVPNARNADTVGHVYLDVVERIGEIPLQLTVDHGSETGVMYAMHLALRNQFAPQYEIDEWPAFVALKSVHNIPIENIWMRFQKHIGRTIKTILKEGHTNLIFKPARQTHMNLFYWLWPQIVQRHLNDFCAYWNNHRVRSQQKKVMPSGTTPNDIWTLPHEYGLQRMNIRIPADAVEALRATIMTSREDALGWVSPDFAMNAEEAYTEVGRPELSVHNGWKIFAEMVVVLGDM